MNRYRQNAQTGAPAQLLPASPAMEAIVARMIQRHDRDWVLLRSFVITETSGSYYRGAKALNLKSGISAVRKRVESLEKRLGRALGQKVSLVYTDGTRHCRTSDGEALFAFLRGLDDGELAIHG